jgi:hypothetical protein
MSEGERLGSALTARMNGFRACRNAKTAVTNVPIAMRNGLGWFGRWTTLTGRRRGLCFEDTNLKALSVAAGVVPSCGYIYVKH